MDVDKFINLVYEHKCLWDQSDANYHFRDHLRKAWREVSDEMKMPVDKLKQRWRGLRDTFVRELKKVTKKKSRNGIGMHTESKWPYFKVLMFLQGTVSRKDLKDKNTPESYEEMDSIVICDMWCGTDSSVDADHLAPIASPCSGQTSSVKHEQVSKDTFQSSPQRKVKRQKLDELDEKKLQIEEDKYKYSQDYENDPDAKFLMSLLPFLKDTPKHRKLFVRAKLQQVFIDEQNDMSSAVQFDRSSDSSQ